MRLISTEEEVAQYVSINPTFKFPRIEPHINRVMRTTISGLLGQSLLESLANEYSNALEALNALPEIEKDALIKSGKIYTLAPEQYHQPFVYLQDAICNIAFMNCLSQMQVNLGEAGIRLIVNENQKTAFQWQVDDIKYQAASDGYAALNGLLIYLEDHIDIFPEWEDSDSYFQQKKYFVESAELFNDAYYISNNRMTFLTLRYIMQRIEVFDVKRIVTPAVFDKLKTSQKSDNGYSSKEKVLVESFLIPGIVLITVAKGIIERAIEVSDLGVQANLYSYYVTLKDARKKSPFESDRDRMVEQLTADGNEFLLEARKYIESNPDEFGPLAESESSTNFRIINKPERKFYGM